MVSLCTTTRPGFAFVYMRDRRDADDAIAALDGREFGYKRRRLRVEWAKVSMEYTPRQHSSKPWCFTTWQWL